MTSKGNNPSNKTATLDELNNRLQSARDSYNRHKDAAAEAVGHVYLLYRETRAGEPRRWLDEEIAELNRSIAKHNKELQDDYDRAKNFRDGKLPKEDELLQPTTDPMQIAKNDETKARLQLLIDMTSQERAKLRRVPLVHREGSSKYVEIVRYVLSFDRPQHAAMVSRYCLAMEWIAAKFDDDSQVDIPKIKAAIEAVEGFDRCIELQRAAEDAVETTESDEQIIRSAEDTEARGVVLGMRPSASVNLTAKKTDGDFVLLVCRPSGEGLDVLGEADLSDREIQRAITKLGEANMLDADANLEFVARVLQLGSIITEKQEVPSDYDPKKKVTTERLVSLRYDANAQPQLVVSVNKADAGPIIHARPKVPELLTLIKGECVLQSGVRRRLEKEVTGKSRRRLLTMKVNTAPKQANGKPAESPLSWEFHNSALAAKNKSTANQAFYWTAFDSVGSKPLDIENFNPQFVGKLEQSDISLIKTHLTDVWTKTNGDDNSGHHFLMQQDGRKLLLKCGDAEPMELVLETDSVDATKLKFKIADMKAIIKQLAEQHATYELAGDPGGLLRISWSDSYGYYDCYLPAIGTDGRYLSRRIAQMRATRMPLAAE